MTPLSTIASYKDSPQVIMAKLRRAKSNLEASGPKTYNILYIEKAAYDTIFRWLEQRIKDELGVRIIVID